MKPVKRSLPILCRILMVALCLVASLGHAHADEETEVYTWVAAEMQIGSVPAMPYIHFVDKERLRAAFRESNQASIDRWKAKYGESEALQIMTRYLEAIVGIFIAQSDTIFIYEHLPPCPRRATLAHEFSHFFQYFTEGAINPDQYDSDILHLVREMEAYKIENKYWAEYCKDYENVVF